MIVYMVISLVILAVGIYLAREKRNDFKMLSLIMTLAIGLAVGVLSLMFLFGIIQIILRQFGV